MGSETLPPHILYVVGNASFYIYILMGSETLSLHFMESEKIVSNFMGSETLPSVS